MSREFQLKEIEGKKCIAFPFQSVREVDDIILQLLNDADQDGFLKSKVNKAQKEIVFDADGLTSLENLPASVLPRDQFIHVLEDLKDDDKLVEMVDCPIVEGAIAASVVASGGASIEDVIEAAKSAREMKKF